MIKISYGDFQDYLNSLEDERKATCKCKCCDSEECSKEDERLNDYLSDREKLLEICDEMMASMGYHREKTSGESKTIVQKEAEKKVKVEKPKCEFCAGGNCTKGSLLYRKVNEIDGMKFVPVTVNNCPICGRQL